MKSEIGEGGIACVPLEEVRQRGILAGKGRRFVDNQHRLIKGYAELTEEQISAMNTLTEIGEQLRLMCDAAAADPDVDKRWLAIARTDLQKGFMALKRSIARPDTF
jgi:hypothetical protein